MSNNFNTYIEGIHADFWQQLCTSEGELRIYRKGEEFISAGTTGRYIGFIKSGTLKYEVYSDNGDGHVIGLEFAGEFVADFPFSLSGRKSRASIIAVTDCEIYCVPAGYVAGLASRDSNIREIVMNSTEAIFNTVYDRYVALYAQTPQQRYNDLISKHPDLFSLFPLKDIASFLNVTPTHLSRLRRKISD